MFGLKYSCSGAVVQHGRYFNAGQHLSLHLKTVALDLVSTVRCDFPQATDLRSGSKLYRNAID